MDKETNDEPSDNYSQEFEIPWWCSIVAVSTLVIAVISVINPFDRIYHQDLNLRNVKTMHRVMGFYQSKAFLQMTNEYLVIDKHEDLGAFLHYRLESGHSSGFRIYDANVTRGNKFIEGTRSYNGETIFVATTAGIYVYKYNFIHSVFFILAYFGLYTNVNYQGRISFPKDTKLLSVTTDANYKTYTLTSQNKITYIDIFDYSRKKIGKFEVLEGKKVQFCGTDYLYIYSDKNNIVHRYNINGNFMKTITLELLLQNRKSYISKLYCDKFENIVAVQEIGGNNEFTAIIYDKNGNGLKQIDLPKEFGHKSSGCIGIGALKNGTLSISSENGFIFFAEEYKN